MKSKLSAMHEVMDLSDKFVGCKSADKGQTIVGVYRLDDGTYVSLQVLAVNANPFDAMEGKS